MIPIPAATLEMIASIELNSRTAAVRTPMYERVATPVAGDMNSPD